MHPFWARPWVVEERFQPDTNVVRAHYAVMLAKAFQLPPRGGALPYGDVPSPYTIYGKFDAVPWLAAAYAASILPESRGAFLPQQEVERQDAVAWLVRALDLEGYARSLPPSDVDALLAPYRDGAQVRPELRAEAAAAVRLRILRGYPDRTLRPRASLTRAEAATLIHRSAWVRVRADPNPFSPDRDGVADMTTILAQCLLNGNLVSWRLWIEDGAGNLLRTLAGAAAGPGRAAAAWDGKDGYGRLLAPGVYYARAEIRSIDAQPRTSAPFPVRLEVKRLDAALHPARVPPGATVGVVAAASAPASSVSALTPWGGVRLARTTAAGGWENWQASFKVPGGVPLGTYPVRVEALFESGGVRSVDLTLEVVAPPGETPEDYGRERLPGVQIALTGADPYAP
ncbi:MAG: S-layer homology domain-containing protein [Firmicutes bacterium]|nr:S-layer homology domain-containing protein [Bacillota bacterium]